MSNASLAVPTKSRMLVFHWLRAHLVRNNLRTLLEQSSVRMFTIFLCSVVIWAFVFTISLNGFLFLQQQHLPPFGSLIGTLFDLLFMALGLMLVISSGLILYSSLFTSAEAAFLLSTPARSDELFSYKFQGAVGFSSWAFLLLGSPVLVSYGIIFSAPWHFYAILPFFFIGFAILPGAVGSLVCLLVVNYVPRRRKEVVAAICLVAVIVLVTWFRPHAGSRLHIWNRDMVQRLFDRFGFSQGVLVPSHWMTKGLQAAGQGHLIETRNQEPGSLYFLALLWTNGLFFYVLAAWLSSRLYRIGYSRIATGGTLRRRYGGAWIDRVFSWTMFALDPQIRLLIVKDFRTFRRDAAQWAQVLIFTGLMILYLTNIRRLFMGDIGWSYQNGISLLNLTAIALLLCTYTGRFIYPMLSLEGQKFWILGLLPLKRERLLWGKFAFSAIGVLLIAELLILLSDWMLEMPSEVIILHLITVVVLAVGLSGLSVGLGACLPNFQETDPSKIAAGLGGTLNLVAGLFFLLVIISLLALPWHVYASMDISTGRPPPPIIASPLAQGLGLLLGSAAAILPLRAGAHALRKMEF